MSDFSDSRPRPLPPVWFELDTGGLRDISRDWRYWLEDRGSLTRRLMAVSGGQFDVEIVRQYMGKPRRDEARELAIAAGRWAMIREVTLYGQGQPWVFARSIIPLTTLTGRQRRLRHLDNRPLGQLLFNDPAMTRGPVQVARLSARWLPESLRGDDEPCWARRSVFRLEGKPLLVSETFLATFDPRRRP